MKRLLKIVLWVYMEELNPTGICMCIYRAEKRNKIKHVEAIELENYINSKYILAHNEFQATYLSGNCRTQSYWWPLTESAKFNSDTTDPRVQFLNHLINELPDEKEEFVITADVG